MCVNFTTGCVLRRSFRIPLRGAWIIGRNCLHCLIVKEVSTHGRNRNDQLNCEMAEEKVRTEARQRFARLQKKASQLGLNDNDILTLGFIQEHQKPVNITRALYKSLFFIALLVGLIGGIGYGGK